MKKSFRILGLGAVVVLITAFLIVRTLPRTKAGNLPRVQVVPAVQVAAPTRETVTDALQYTGTMTPIQQADVYAKVYGNLEAVFVNIGQAVRSGQMLAVIDTTLLAQQYHQAEATFMNDSLQFVRTQTLYTENLGAKADVDNARAAMDVAQATRNDAATQLGYARITAPFSGTITRRLLDPGAVVTAGNATLFTLMDLDSLKVLINVIEKDIPRVTKGQRVQLVVDAYPDRIYTGVVRRSSEAEATDTRTMIVEIDAPNPDHSLKAGMFANVHLILDQRDQALTIPTSAVLRDSTRQWIFAVADSTAHRMTVETGVEQNNRTEIIKGLTGTEKVVVVGQQFVKDGGPVRIQP
jgi:RND family efflux transporter MFP subunit